MSIRITVFGLGRRGAAIASDLVAAGADVHAYDPQAVPTPDGVQRHVTPFTAVEHAEIICALTSSRDALDAMAQALDVIPPSALYADFADPAGDLKTRLGAIAATAGLKFADITLRRNDEGASLPPLARGPGAARLVELLGALGIDAERAL